MRMAYRRRVFGACVVRIAAPRAARTPQGIGVGSTLAQVRAVYSNLSVVRNGGATARISNDPSTRYAFLFDPDSRKVARVTLIRGVGMCGN